jgi:hypothetical protein
VDIFLFSASMSAMLVCVPAALKQKIFDSQQSISLALISQFNYGVSPVCVCVYKLKPNFNGSFLLLSMLFFSLSHTHRHFRVL